MPIKTFEEFAQGYLGSTPFGENSLFHPTSETNDENTMVDIGSIDNISQTIVPGKPNSANGYYYQTDGTFFAKEGNSEKIVLCTAQQSHIYKKDNKNYIGLTYSAVIHTDFIHEDLEELASLVYAEGSIKYQKDLDKVALSDEAFAIATAMINYKYKRRENEGNYSPGFKQLSNDMHLNGKGAPLYNIFKGTDPLKRNSTHMQVCIQASINALAYEFFNIERKQFTSKEKIGFTPSDLSNGAIGWDGIDLKNNEKKHPKMLAGYLVSDAAHNVLNVSSHAVHACATVYKKEDPKFHEERCWDYKYETTVGLAKTMFVKLNEQYLYSNINSEGKQGRWW